MNKLFIKKFTAEAIVSPRRIVKFGTSDSEVLQNAAATTKGFGVADSLGGEAIGDSVDVVMAGIAEVEYGGTVTRGDDLVADSVGRAVVAAAAAGVNDHVIGMCMKSGVVGDIGEVFLSVAVKQG